MQFLRLLTISIWVGGIVFFAFVLAPVAFHTLPSAHEAGMVVRGSILILHRLGSICGAIFIAATLLLRWMGPREHARILVNQALICFAMVLVTAISMLHVLPRMESDRARAGGAIESLSLNDPIRLSFDRFHRLSEKLEGAVFFLGVGVLILMVLPTKISLDQATAR